MKKKIHTHCKYAKCGKKLPYPSATVHYCRNNNKCKNDYHNSIRKAKTDLADALLETTLETYELEKKLTKLLNDRRIRTIPIQDLDLMGIDLTSPLLSLAKYHDLTFIEFEFSNFQLFYFVEKDEVSVWRNRVA